MFSHAAAGQRLPRRVSTDHDPLFRFHRWLANLRVREIEEIKTVPYAPVSHPFVERPIGTLRRDYLDCVFFWNATDLRASCKSSGTITTSLASIAGSLGVTPMDQAGRPSPARATLAHYAWQ